MKMTKAMNRNGMYKRRMGRKSVVGNAYEQSGKCRIDLRERHVVCRPRKTKGRMSLITPVTIKLDEAQTDVLNETENELYDFERQWYPVAVAKDLLQRTRKREPIAVWLLGKRLVLWRDHQAGLESGDWSASLDMCPHRLAPLSEGRVEDGGQLMCSYHGWRFEESTGKCLKIPQAPEGQEEAMCSKPKACLQMLPTQERYGLVWVWPDGSAEGVKASLNTPALTLEPLEGEEHTIVENYWYQRDIPAYDWDTLIENLVDPSHVPFAHHGIQGDRNREGGFKFGLKLAHLNKDEGVRVNVIPKSGPNSVEEADKFKGSFIEFRAPFFVRYNFSRPGTDISTNLCIICVPTKPGQSRVIFKFAIMNGHLLPKIAQLFIKYKPVWLDHLVRNKVFDSDCILLHEQEKELPYGHKEGWRQGFHMPTSADVLVTGFRNWIDRYTNGGPHKGRGSVGSQTQLDKRTLLDRYHQHTVHCSACKGAMRNLRFGQVFTGFLLIASVTMRNLIGAFVCCFAMFMMEKLRQRFLFVDHIHAHVD